MSQRFVFSDEKNIIVFVLDAFGDHLFPKLLKFLPEIEQNLDGFVRFDDVLGSGGYTQFSVPSYIGGMPYLNKTTVDDYRKAVFSG